MVRETLFLDLAPGSARFVLAAKRGPRTHILHAEIHPLPADMFTNDLPNPTPLGEFLLARLKMVHFHPRYAYLLLPDPLCFLFSVTTQPHDAGMMDEAIRWESTQHIPMDINTVTLDWRAMTPREHGDVRIEVAATQTTVAEAYASTAEAAHLLPIHLEPRSLALFRAVHETINVDPVLLIAVNQSATTIFHQSQHGIPLLATFPTFSLERCIAVLHERLRLEREDAQKALLTYGLDAKVGDGVIRTALQDELNALAQEIERYDAYAGKTPQAFLALSPDLRIPGLQEALADLTQRKPLPVVRVPFQWTALVPETEKRLYTALLGAINFLV